MTTSTLAIANLRGLGPKSQAILAKIGIDSLSKLQKAGAVATFVKAKQLDRSVSLNLLYGLVSAIEDSDWRQVRRERKLELLTAVERYESRKRAGAPSREMQLQNLRNIGKAMSKDFELLHISSVKQLARCDADELYARIQTLTGTRHDPCVWDTYAAAIHQAKTGEALPWWEFSKIRKSRVPVSAVSRLRKVRSADRRL